MGEAKSGASDAGRGGARSSRKAIDDRAVVNATVWLTEAIHDRVKARMAAEGRRSRSDFLRAMIVRGLGEK